MLTGELPLGRFAAPSEKSTVNRGVDEVVLRALEKERERRQQSATEMKTQVEGASAHAAPAAPLRTAASYTCTPENRFSLRGLIYIYTGKGRLALDESTLTFASDAEQIRIPLGSIREIGIGNYSGFAKPTRLDFFSVFWEEAGIIHTRLFTPHESLLSLSWETNKLVAEWAAAVRTAAGRVLGRARHAPAVGAPFHGVDRLPAADRGDNDSHLRRQPERLRACRDPRDLRFSSSSHRSATGLFLRIHRERARTQPVAAPRLLPPPRLRPRAGNAACPWSGAADFQLSR